MKINYINIDDKTISSFGFIICEENGQLLTPVYNILDRVSYFRNVEVPRERLIDICENIDIRVGSKCVYAYYNNGVVHIGKKRLIKVELIKLLYQNKIHSPFSALDVIDFLKITGRKKLEIYQKCHTYLSDRISTGALKMWEDSVSYNAMINKKAIRNNIATNKVNYGSPTMDALFAASKYTTGSLTSDNINRSFKSVNTAGQEA